MGGAFWLSKGGAHFVEIQNITEPVQAGSNSRTKNVSNLSCSEWARGEGRNQSAGPGNKELKGKREFFLCGL